MVRCGVPTRRRPAADRRISTLLVPLLATIVAPTARGDTAPVPGDAADVQVLARRSSGAITIDGRIDEAAWASAAPYTGFVQLAPDEGRPPTERTELRVMYDDDALYVGVHCFDRTPDQIVRNLGRRDSDTASDAVTVFIDSKHDRRTAFVFQLTASGVLSDRLVFHDDQVTTDWDEIWDGSAAMLRDGWSAELRIPLRTLRFDAQGDQTWGFTVQRTIARRHEIDASTFQARAARGIASGLGELAGLTRLRPRRSLLVAPFLTMRGVIAPQFSDPAMPEPRLLALESDLGLDFRWTLSTDMTLTGTINPDFGLVDADQIILNLTRFEVQFPEKRPFFASGMELFQPLEGSDSQHQVFYTRRIGLDGPIAGAAKLSGTLGSSTDLGIIDAVIAGASSPHDEAHPDRSYRFHASQPLHLAPSFALPGTEIVPRNYFAAVVRGPVSSGFTLGGIATSALPLGGTCSDRDAAQPDPPAICQVRGGNAAALDFTVRSADASWISRGQLAASQAIGGPPKTILPEGGELDRGALGTGVTVTAGKLGGEPFRFLLQYIRASPAFDLNASGFQPQRNNQNAYGKLSLIRPAGIGSLHSLEVFVAGETQWSTDGRQIHDHDSVGAELHAVLPAYDSLNCNSYYYHGGLDIYEIVGTGIPFEHRSQLSAECQASTDENARVSVNASLAVGWTTQPRLPAFWGWVASAGLTARPVTWFLGDLSLSAGHNPAGVRFIAQDGDQLAFGDLDPRTLSIITHHNLVFSRTLTLQLYAQLFLATGHYKQFYQASASLPAVHRTDLVATPAVLAPDLHEADLNLNAVLRWEYRTGSTLFVGYTRAQSELPTMSSSLLPGALERGPTTDTFAVKFSYLWDL